MEMLQNVLKLHKNLFIRRLNFIKREKINHSSDFLQNHTA